MGQLEELYVPRSMLQAEEKRRQEAEKRLEELLRYMDPQPEYMDGEYYGPPPEPGDLAHQVLSLVEHWEKMVQQETRALLSDFGEGRADVLKRAALQLRRALGGHGW